MASNVEISIAARLDPQNLNRSIDRMHRDIHQAADVAGKDWANTFTRTAKVDAGKLTPGSGRFTAEGARDGRAYGSAFERAAKDPIAQAVDRIQGQRVRKEADNVAKGLLGIADAAQNTGSAFAHLGATGPVALGIIGIAAYNLAGAAISASQALWLLPGAFAAIGAGVLTAKIGLSGFSDAISDMHDAKKFAEDLQSLSPNAQQAALGIRAMLPVLDRLKAATQDALFNNVGPQLNQLANAYLPAIQQMTTTIATGFNSAFSGIANAMMNPQTMQTMQVTMQNIGQAFQNIAPAAPAIAQALTDIINVGSGFLPQIATQISNAATAFQEFIANARESGQLRQWLADGLNTISDLVDLGKAVVKVFWELKPTAEVALKGTTLLWQGLGGAIDLSKRSIDVFSTAFSGITTVVSAVGSAVMPILDNIRDAIDRMLAPVRTAIDWANKVPGVHIDQIPSISGNTPGYSGGSGTFGPPPIPQGGPVGSGNGAHGGYADRRRAGMPNTAGGPLVPAIPQGGYAVPLPPPDGSSRGGGAAKSGAPTVPYSGDPMSLLTGYPVTSSLYSAAQSVLESRQKVAQDQADLNKLLASNTATESDIQDARNKLLKDQQDQQESELHLNEAKQNSTKRFQKSTEQATKVLDDITSGIDFSGGIPGLIKGLIQSVATLAAAPLLGQLQAIKQSNSGEGSGLLGIAAARGVFGEQYTPQAINAANQPQQGYGGPGYGYAPTGGYAPAGQPLPGESARDFAHRVMMPFWQSQGLTVGDHAADRYGEHQNGAVDIMVPSIARGQQVLQQVLSDPNVYGAIFNNQTYGYGHGLTPQDYTAGHTGNPTQDHQDHVHAWYKPNGANNIVPASPGYAPTYTNPVAPQGPTYAGPSANPYDLSDVPMLNGGSLGSGAPTAYAPAPQPQAAPGWQPRPSGAGGGGGLLGGALSAAAGLFPGAGAGAQLVMQLAQRSIQQLGEYGSIAASGLMDTLEVKDPDGAGGTSMKDSWLGRLATSMMSASPQIPSAAAKQDKQPDNNGQQQNPQPGNTTNHGQQGGIAIQNMTVNQANDNGQSMVNQFAYASAAAGQYR